jgi:hypothetical protein
VLESHLGFCPACPLLIEKSEFHGSGDFNITISEASVLAIWMDVRDME